MIDYHVVKNWAFDKVRYDYTERDCMLYALGIGMGSEPTDSDELRFVYEQGLRVVPTMAAVMGAPGAWWKDPRTGANAVRLVHGEQHLRFHRPLPVRGFRPARATMTCSMKISCATTSPAGCACWIGNMPAWVTLSSTWPTWPRSTNSAPTRTSNCSLPTSAMPRRRGWRACG